jgi:Holliday junction resolvase RusA-like endonuclease
MLLFNPLDHPDSYFDLVFPFVPVPWKRAGNCRGRFYDTQVAQKKAVRDFALTKIESSLNIKKVFSTVFCFYFSPPKSLSTKKKISLINHYHRKKPDIDNLVKFYLDALKGILWEDDAQIPHLTASKFYCDQPRTEIEIYYS